MANAKKTRSAPAASRALIGLVRACAHLPLGWAQRLGLGLGRLAWLLGGRARRVTDTNLNLCLADECSAAERRRLARQSLRHTGAAATELGALWVWPENQVATIPHEVQGRERLDEARAKGRGLILAAPHLGAWEFMNVYLARHFPYYALYRPPRIAELEAFTLHARERLGSVLVAADGRGVRRLFKALSEGSVLGILPDQEPGPSGGVFAPFFGVEAWTMTLVPRLLRRTGAELLFCYAERLGPGQGYRVVFRDAPEGVDDPDPRTAATQLNRGVEACVRAIPEQYQWSYKRFQTRPEGVAKRYG